MDSIGLMGADEELNSFVSELFSLNRIQWELEDKVRNKKTWEAAIEARNNNSKRVEVKNKINELFNFPIEQKEYLK
jgi:hypothetical protein